MYPYISMDIIYTHTQYDAEPIIIIINNDDHHNIQYM